MNTQRPLKRPAYHQIIFIRNLFLIKKLCGSCGQWPITGYIFTYNSNVTSVTVLYACLAISHSFDSIIVQPLLIIINFLLKSPFKTKIHPDIEWYVSDDVRNSNNSWSWMTGKVFLFGFSLIFFLCRLRISVECCYSLFINLFINVLSLIFFYSLEYFVAGCCCRGRRGRHSLTGSH